jgi:hypothetical protein
VRVTVTHTFDRFARDARAVPVKAARGFAKVTRDNARLGNRVAKEYARESAGDHGKHYHKAFSAEKTGRGPYQWEYGPVADRPQGGMSFEGGSRNQPPHLDLARSQDHVGPAMAEDMHHLLSGLFW